MAKDKGWIKISRAIVDLPFWNDAEKVKAFLDLHLMANYKDSQFIPRGCTTVVTVHAGEIFTSVTNLAGHWGWSKKRVRGYLEMLENLNLCHVKGHANGTTLTLVDIDSAIEQGHANDTAKVPAGVSAGVSAEVSAGVTRLKKDKNRLRTSNKNKKGAMRGGFDLEEFE